MDYVVFARNWVSNQKWLDADHPRDRQGRFAEKPGGGYDLTSLTSIPTGFNGPDQEPKDLVNPTEDQRAAVEEYTVGGFELMNPVLRGDSDKIEAGSVEDAVKSIVALRETFQHETRSEARVFRGVSAKRLGIDLNDRTTAFNRIGQTFADDAFLSTAAHTWVATKPNDPNSRWGEVDMEIVLPKGFKYLDTRKYAGFSALANHGDWQNPKSSDEEEWLLPERTELTLVGVAWPQGSTRPRLLFAAAPSSRPLPSAAELIADAESNF